MVTDQFNFKKQERVYSACLKVIFFIIYVLNYTISTLILLWYIKGIKTTYVGYTFLTSELVHLKELVSGSLKISNCDRSNDRYVLLSTVDN